MCSNSSRGLFPSESLSSQGKKKRERSSSSLTRVVMINRSGTTTQGSRSRRLSTPLTKRLRKLRNLIPNLYTRESFVIDQQGIAVDNIVELFKETSDYILFLQKRVKDMKIMVHTLSPPTDDSLEY